MRRSGCDGADLGTISNDVQIAKEPKLSPKKASEKLFPKRLFYKRF